MDSSNKQALKLKFKSLTIDTQNILKNSDSQKALTLLNSSNVLENNSRKVRTFQTLGKNQKIHDLNPLQISTKFWDLFEKKHKLGQGAHSVVYECIEKSSRKSYAVKVPQNLDAEKIKDIKQSFLILKQLNHPYILKTESFYIQEKQQKCFIVSELCNYQDLRSYIQKSVQSGQNIKEEQVVKILKKILLALKYLKMKGVCHRDIKPQNILYEPSSGNLKIIDFELARMKKYEHQNLDLWTDTGSLFYRAPESFAFGYNQAVDTWALGVIAYQMLTGELPFASTSIKGTIKQIKNKSIDQDTLRISNLAKKFLLKMLEKDPENRLTPEEALKEPFILKNSLCNDSKFKISGVVQQPTKRSLLKFPIEVSTKHANFDETFMSTYLRFAQKANGIKIIH